MTSVIYPITEQPITPSISTPRKRTTSFSTPTTRPLKAPRMAAGLKRTTSYITLPGLEYEQPPAPPRVQQEELPYIRTLQFFKERREKRKARVSLAISTVTATPVSPPPSSPLPQPSQKRTSSPLSPLPRCGSLPQAPQHRRKSKNVEPDLYRIAITACMKTSEHGQRILKFGARVAVLQATVELESIVRDREGDILMYDSYWDD